MAGPPRKSEPASPPAQRQSAALYLVGTPIGNLEDITLRALRLLREVTLIACEDTRQTRKLLNHYDITTRTVSYHEHNERERAPELLELLRQGVSLALVSDAGMPVISDPGKRLIALCIAEKIAVIPVPGASAFLCALIASGLPCEGFRHGGFLPAKRAQRMRLLEGLRGSHETEIFYEAPHRIVETLKDVVAALGAERYLVIAREITKLHEEFIRGTAGSLLQQMQNREVRGEITLLIDRAGETLPAPAPARKSVAQRMQELLAEENFDEKTALKAIAKEAGVSKSEVYREWQRTKRD